MTGPPFFFPPSSLITSPKQSPLFFFLLRMPHQRHHTDSLFFSSFSEMYSDLVADIWRTEGPPSCFPFLRRTVDKSGPSFLRPPPNLYIGALSPLSFRGHQRAVFSPREGRIREKRNIWPGFLFPCGVRPATFLFFLPRGLSKRTPTTPFFFS